MTLLETAEEEQLLGGGFTYDFYFHPEIGEMIQFDVFFQMGWFNYQLESRTTKPRMSCLLRKSCKEKATSIAFAGKQTYKEQMNIISFLDSDSMCPVIQDCYFRIVIWGKRDNAFDLAVSPWRYVARDVGFSPCCGSWSFVVYVLGWTSPHFRCPRQATDLWVVGQACLVAKWML